MANQPRGLVASRTLDGRAPNAARLYRTHSKNTARIWSGDLVYLDADGAVQSYTAAASANTPILGVVDAVYDRSGGHPKPKTHALPSGIAGAEVSADSFIAVHDDPAIVFVGMADASSGQTDIGKYASVSAGTPVTAAGRSGAVIKNSSTEASAGGGAILKIVGLAPSELDRTGGTNNDIEVVIAHHHFNTEANTR